MTLASAPSDHLTYYAELARRLAETAETIHNPAGYADLHQAAGALSDLASIKFALFELAGECRDREVAKELVEPIEAPG